MEKKESKLKIYYSLLDEIKEMVDNKERGYEVTQSLNDEFWEELDAHKDRMEEQLEGLKNERAENLDQELKHADSVYEATRLFIRKYND